MVIWIVIVSYLIYLSILEYKHIKLKKMRDKLKIGDCVITAGGLTGIIEKLETESVIILAEPSEDELRVEKKAIMKYKESGNNK